MSWFDIVKDAKDDAKKFFDGFQKTIVEQVTGTLEQVDKDLKSLEEAEKAHEAMIASLNPIERAMLQPIIERQIETREEARADINMTHNILNNQLKEIKEMFKESAGYPIETKLILLREHFGEFPGFDGKPIIDMKVLNDVIHNLGFEGKGLE
tara:strand:- start:1255 stop:1713 length:459 start_codon:yes stop_codon:yes gene_type:complete